MLDVQPRTLTSFIRGTTFQGIFGQKLLMGVRPSCTQETYIAKRNDGYFAKTLTNADYNNHFAGNETFYFFGTPRISDLYTLVMIDIDVLKSKKLGSTSGAIAFANFLKKKWHDLYFEPSTNGKGIHCYIRLRKFQVGAEAVNQSLERLEAWLDHVAKDFDVEMVEVKGHCPVFHYKNNKIVSMKSGTFAKIPRQATLNDLSHTTILDWQDLRRQAYDVPEIKKLKCKTGSASKELPQEYVDQLPSLKQFWSKFAPALSAYGGRHVTCEDGAAFLCITKFLTESPFKENRLSVRTILSYWQTLYVAGHTNRSPNHHIVKTIRDHLSQRGLIHWLSNEYQPPTAEDSKDGVCCRWCLMGDFVDVIDSFLTREETERENVDTDYTAYRGRGKYLFPVMKMLREEAQTSYLLWAEQQIDLFFASAA